MAARWEELFDELAELAGEERAARLERVAAEDPDLGRRLSELLAADARSTERLLRPVLEGSPGFVSAALGAQPAGRDRTGERVGRYRLVSLLGRGGMGEVWLADRADGEFESRVALKLIRSGGGSEAILARFLHERQILARLDHPGIARLLDGGRSDDGEPYFVLEYVDGTPITDWCAQRGLPLGERVRRVAEVCDAVDHAHRSLIVHRDLKPSNILVDRQGRTKLLDFGVAKLLQPEGGPVAEDSRTRLGGVGLTPAYAAPEQILGEPATTATDVYALGVLLYELLTGDHPHRRRSRSFAALVRAVETETVERPSARLRREAGPRAGPAERRRIARRAELLEGDLDAIVGRALARAPALRYPSAAALGDDLRRYLDGRPVRARPDTVGYRTGRFVRRHRWSVAAAAVVVLSLAGGLAAALVQADRARREASRADRARDFLVDLFRQADPSRTMGERITARTLLEVGAARIDEELASEPAVRADLLDAVAQAERGVGLLEEARRRADQAVAATVDLHGAGSKEEAARRVTLAEVLYDLGELEAAGRELDAAGGALGPAAERAEGELAQRFADARIGVAWQSGDLDRALVEARRFLAVAEAAEGGPSGRAALLRLAVAGLLMDSSRVAEAVALVRGALPELERSPGLGRFTVAQGRMLAAEMLFAGGEHAAAEPLMAAAVEQMREALGADHPTVAQVEIKLGYQYGERRRHAEADAVLRHAIAVLAPLGHFEEGAARRYLGFSLMARERFAEAEAEFRAAEAIARERLGADSLYALGARTSRGWALLAQGRLAEAEEALRSAAADLEAAEGPASSGLRTAWKYLGEVRRRRGDVAEALALHRRAREVELEIFGSATHLAVAGSDLQLALDLLERKTAGDLAEARRFVDEGLATVRRLDPENPRLEDLLAAGGRIALASGDRARARTELGEALARRRARLGEDHPETVRVRGLLVAAAGEETASP